MVDSRPAPRDLAGWLVKCVVNKTIGVFNAGGGACLTWVPTQFLRSKEVVPWIDLPLWVGDEVGYCTARADKAKAKGLVFRPIVDTAEATLEYWLSLPDERPAKLKTGLGPEKEAAVLVAWNTTA